MQRKESSTKPKTAKRKADPAECLVFSIQAFCERHGISKPTLYKMWAEGNGPAFMQIGRRVLIPIEAATAWRLRMTKPAGEVVEHG